MAKTFFTDGDIRLKLPGTRVVAAWLNKVFSHRHDGKNEDGSAPLDYAVDTGAVNSLAIAMSPPLTAHAIGMPIWVKVGHANTAAVTITIDTLEAVPVIHNNGDALLANDIKVGQVIGLIYTGASYQYINYQSPPVTNAQTLNSQTAAQLAPPGALMGFATQTTPSGWLFCDGREVLRVGPYAALFAAIGTLYGAGDNVTTFNVPDLRGEFMRGWDSGRGIDPDREFGSWQADAIKSHIHPNTTPANIQGSTSGGDWHYFGNPGDSGAYGGDETRPRNLAVKICIKY